MSTVPQTTASTPPSAADLSPWAPFRSQAFRWLWIATVVSNIGTWMHDVGAGWLMTSLAPTPLMVALVQAATTLPVVMLALPAGALADILDRRRYLIATQSWMAIVAAVLGILTLLHLTNAWTLLALTFLLGIGTALNLPAWSATAPELVPRAHLPAALALNSMGMNVSRAIGPALAGVIIALSGSAAVFLVNALSFLGVIRALVWWRHQPRNSSLPAERLWTAMHAGLRHARHSPPLLKTLVRGGAFFLFASASWALLPLIARQELHGGPELYGLLVGGIGVGAVSGALLLPRLRARFSYHALVAGGTLLHAGAMLTLAHVHNVALVALAMLASGVAWITVLSSLQVSAQTALPTWVRARGLSIFMVVFMGGMALGSIVWGHLATVTSMPFALTVAAIGAAIGTVATRRIRLGGHEQLDLRPSRHWPAPLLAEPPEPDRGPVMVSVEYRIDPARAEEFARVMQELRRQRRRDGAFFWELFQDATEPARFVEYFMVESWLEHLRQHERVTVADRDIQERASAFHLGPEPPQVRHLLAPGTALKPLPIF